MKRISVLLLLAVATLFVVGRQTISDAAPAPDTELPPITRPADDGTDSQSPEELAQFLQSVENDVNETWAAKFEAAGRQYSPAGLQLYVDGTYSACGATDGSVGPFYCPADQTVYLGLGFMQGLGDNLGAPGDFAKAYVVAHEVGHHVQNLLGVTGSVDQRDSSASVAVELQADCLAGVWGNDAQQRGLIENGDLDEGLNAAASVGDDVLMAQAGQTVNPDNFTHGSAEERASWLLRGFNTGSPDSCDTFSAA
jgi:predicted metalloprotease